MIDQLEVLRRPFDIEAHKEAFVNYLEVCIDQCGTVHYAVPSHARWLLLRYMEQEGIETDLDAWELVPMDACAVDWLCAETGCVAVWEKAAVGEANQKQRATLRRLRLAGLYKGAI